MSTVLLDAISTRLVSTLGCVPNLKTSHF